MTSDVIFLIINKMCLYYVSIHGIFYKNECAKNLAKIPQSHIFLGDVEALIFLIASKKKKIFIFFHISGFEEPLYYPTLTVGLELLQSIKFLNYFFFFNSINEVFKMSKLN